MELTCPKCGETVPAEKINIQELVAICPACDNLFRFDERLPQRKAKRRKVQQPDRLNIREEDGRVELSYQRVFSSEEKVVLGVFTLVGFVMSLASVGILSEGGPIPVAIILLLVVLGAIYVNTNILFNTTRITIDDLAVAVRKGPLPWPGETLRGYNRDDIARIVCEETDESRKSISTTQYYHIFAEAEDGSRQAILKGMPKDYAFYIAQEIESYWGLGADAPPPPRLTDEAAEDDESPDLHMLDDDSAVQSSTT